MLTTHVDAEQMAALGRLTSGVATVLGAGGRIPCTEDPPLWVSEDREDQRAAAFKCLRCPLLTSCRFYVETHDEAAGVWGALTEVERRGGDDG